jgi:hypothetical protein
MRRADTRERLQILSSTTLGDISILCCIPLLQAAINDGWIYSSVGGFDSWVYFGYGLNYADPNYLDNNYKISRLPWILLEFVSRKVFDPVIASWILQIGSLALGSASLYLLFVRTLDRRSAFLGAAIFAAYPFAHSSGGGDYHNTIAGSLYALTWWLAVRAAGFSSPLRLFSTGGAAALTVHSNIVFVNLLPIVALHYFWSQPRFDKNSQSRLRALMWPAIGATVITFLLGLCNKSVGRGSVFFIDQFHIAFATVLDSSNQKPFYHSWSNGWYGNAPYIGFFTGIFVFAILSLFMPKVRAHRQPFVYCASFVFAGSIWLFWQLLGQTALDWQHFAYPLVFPLIGFVAAMFAIWTQTAELKLGPKLLFVGIIIGGIASFSTAFELGWLNPSMIIALVLGLSFGGFLIFSPRNARVWAGAAALTLAMAFSMSYYSSPAFYALSRCALPRSFERAIDLAHRLIRSKKEANSLSFGQVFLWAEKFQRPTIDVSPVKPPGWIDPISYDGCQETTSFSAFEPSLASTLGFTYVEPPWGAENTDAIPAQSLERLTSTGGLVVFITDNPERVERLRQRISEEAGGKPGEKQLYIIEAGGLRMPMYLFLMTAKY